MSWCRQCRTEYDEGIERCADCGANLVPDLSTPLADPPVVVFYAKSVSEAEIAQATLRAEGIDSYVQHSEPYKLSQPIERQVLVAAIDAQAAIAVLKEATPSSAELSALAQQMQPEEDE